MKSKKTLFFILGAVIILLVVSVVGKKAGVIGKRSGEMVAVEKAEARVIMETVSANGKIQPETEVKISPDVSGEIVELYVKEGDLVKQGDALAVIRPDVYRSAVDRMEASVNTNRANLANAIARLEQARAQFINTQATHKRNESLWQKKAISEADFDASKASFEVAAADVAAAEQSVKAAEFNISSAMAALKEARDNLAKTEIFAPISGTIYGLKVEKGERVVGTTQMAGTEMMRIADLDGMEVNVEVNENDIVRVALGDTSTIEVDAYLDKEFLGVVTEIANSANTTGLSMDQVTNFIVKIRILPDSYKALAEGKQSNYSPFRPGMSATVDIQTEKVTNVVSVPIQSVTTRDEDKADTDLSDKSAERSGEKGDKKESDSGSKQDSKMESDKKEKDAIKTYVFVVKDGKAVLTPVVTGIQDNTYIELKSGISVDQEVVTAPYSAISRTLKDGRLVEVVDKSKLFDAQPGQ
ncbi:MAG: efflux RND transporter periplasmic adaptor subunit [Flavobacteriales bacterium]|nr:efflux RND transporter periplasmic adaptor subunit [Flavobacteriales bacterium]